jgi:acetyl-CoA acetyltransferase
MANHSDELEQRVMKLEQFHAEKMTALALLSERHDRTAEHLDKMESVLMQVRDRVMSWRDCPSPGMCVDLDKTVQGIKDEVSSIKTDRAIVVGGWKLIGIIGAGVMAVGAGAYSVWLFLEKVIHGHKP